MKLENLAHQAYLVAMNEAKLKSHEYVTPEHFLFSILMFDLGKEIIEKSGGNVSTIQNDLMVFFDEKIDKNPNELPIETIQFTKIFEFAAVQASSSLKNVITLGDLIISIFNLQESYANYCMQKNGVSRLQMLKVISHDMKFSKTKSKDDERNGVKGRHTEFLKQYTVNLTDKAKMGHLDPIIGRSDIISRTVQVLCRRTKNNPLHIGDPGVGKTAIVEGLAQLIAAGEVPYILKNSNLYYIDMGVVIAGTKYRGDFEERLIKILDIISREENAIIYIDEIHSLIGTGSVSGSHLDAAGILKPYLTNGKIKFIGATTYDEYRKHLEKDRALARRFQKIDVSEPSVADTEKILVGLKERYEAFHNVEYTADSINMICVLSAKYLQDRAMPDKAIDVMDETGACVRMHASSKKTIVIKRSDIERTVAVMSNIPERSISANELEELKSLEDNLKSMIFGQNTAIERLVSAIKSSRSGLADEERPVANLLFVGPTGVGKTELSKSLAKLLGIKLIRFDMSEYQEKHSVSKLIGSPPGYVGYEEGGLLCESVKKSPYCVLLLDEIEKAHPDILNVLLQIMDYGTLTDNTGRKADFRNVTLIMTSNAGAAEMGKNIIGFEDSKAGMGAVEKAVIRIFSPEFRNRLDEIIYFNNIDDFMAIKIAEKAVHELADKLKEKNVRLKMTDEAIAAVARKGISGIYGAREINRLVDKEIKKKLIDHVLFGKLQNGGTVAIDYKDKDFVMKITERRRTNVSGEKEVKA